MEQAIAMFYKVSYLLNLPEYKHTMATANFARLLKEIKQGNLTCSACLAKNDEREPFVDYSVATDIWIPNGIIFRQITIN